VKERGNYWRCLLPFCRSFDAALNKDIAYYWKKRRPREKKKIKVGEKRGEKRNEMKPFALLPCRDFYREK
jgi:hypothetical protein